MGFYSSNLGY